MQNPLVKKLSRFVRLSAAEKQVLEDATLDVVTADAHTDLVREGDRPSTVRVIVEGFACRYKLLRGGGRQIVAFIVPGDICNAHIFVLDRMDHAIATLSPCKIAQLSSDDILRMTERHPAITRALWLATLVDEAVSREWITNIGRRRAMQRVAHLLCEVSVRLTTVDLVTDGQFELPMTPVELADTVSISHVHINRVLRQLRDIKVITRKDKNVRILDLNRLKEIGGFEADYLHLNGIVLDNGEPR